MAAFPFELTAQLVFTVLDDHVLIVAEDNFVIINFKDHAALERVMDNLLPASSGNSSKGIGAILEKAKEVNDKVVKTGLVVDIRVNNKTYVELGSGSSPRITASAVIGKVGSWFKKS